MAPNLEIAGLLEESGWLRALAANLIGDGTQADDLVQDTWLAALRRPPRSASEPRPWLARVARNLARNTRRERTRRAAREEFVAEERAHPGPDALAQQAEAQRLLADAVTRLAEPLRAVIVLRYFQGLDSSAAAARLGLPASTVRTRLQRALEELRADLDRSFEGGRAGWGLVLAPLVHGAQGAPSSAPAPAGAASLSSWSPAFVASAGAACALAAAGALYLGLRHQSGEGELALATLPSAVVEVRAQGTQESSGRREALPPVPTRVPVSSSGTTMPTVTALPNVEPGGTVLAGTILVDGRPPEWPIELTLEPTVPPVTPGDMTPRMRMRRDVLTIPPEQGGKFKFGALSPTWSGQLIVSDFPLENGEHSLAIDAPQSGLVLALVSGPAVVGRILDPHGQPVSGLEGTCQRRLGRAAQRPGGEKTLVEEEALTFVCRADGRFRIPNRNPGDWSSLTLSVEAEQLGYLRLDTPDFVPAEGCDLGDLALEPLRGFEFRVHDPQGAPIEGAFARVEPILLARRSAGTGPDGSGKLAFAPDREVDVRVSAAGYADRVCRAPLTGPLDVELESLAVLDIGFAGSLPEQADRVRVSAERSAFVWDESHWDERADLQAELGGSRPGMRRGPANDGRCEYEFGLLRYGHVRLVGLVPDVPLTIEALAPDGRVLATVAASVGTQARSSFELGDPSSSSAAPMPLKVPMRRSHAPSQR